MIISAVVVGYLLAFECGFRAASTGRARWALCGLGAAGNIGALRAYGGNYLGLKDVHIFIPFGDFRFGDTLGECAGSTFTTFGILKVFLHA